MQPNSILSNSKSGDALFEIPVATLYYDCNRCNPNNGRTGTISGDVNPANIINVEEEVRALNFDFLKKRSEGKDEQAIAVVKKAIEISEKQLGENNLYTGISLNNLGVLYISQNKLAEAKTLLQRAQKVFERTLGPDHPETAASLNNLARVYFSESNYAEALPLHQRALKIYEKNRGPDHPDTARNLGYLANVYFALGNHAAALSLQQRALAIEEKKLGPDHPDTATTLGDLALIYSLQGNYAEAISMHRRALKIKENLDPNHPDVAKSLTHLAMVFMWQENYDEAFPLYQRALKINEKSLGPEHFETMSILNNMALLYSSQAKYAEAIPLYQRIVNARERALGSDHPKMATSLANLALALEATGDNHSHEVLDRCMRASVSHSRSTLPILSSKEQELFLREHFNSNYKISLSQSLRHPERAALSASWPLNGKGIVQDVLSSNERANRDITDPKLGSVVKALQQTRHQLAAIAMNAIDAQEQSERQKTIDQLSKDVERLSGELAQATGASVVTDKWVELDDLRKAMSPDTVFVDVVRFRVVDFEVKGNGNKWKDAHYAAWITPAAGQGDVKLIDLGLASEIDSLIATIRKSMGPEEAIRINTQGEEAVTKALSVPMQQLADRIWLPIKPLLGEATQIILSPDGPLWLVPWSALPIEGDDQLLIEKYALRLVISGREVLTQNNQTDRQSPTDIR